MKTIILFSRSELVHLYGRVGNLLSDKYKIIHLAYSEEEESILRIKYKISDVLNFRKEIASIYKNELLDIELCNLIDKIIIDQSNNRFNLNSSIQSDRSFKYVTYTECLVLCQTYYKFWNNLVNKNSVDFVLHEPNSLFFNQISSFVCKNYNAKFITQIQVYGEEKINYLIVSADDGTCEEIPINYEHNFLSDDDKIRVQKFLDVFRSSITMFFNFYSKKKLSFFKLLGETLMFSLITLKHQFIIMKNRFGAIDHLDLFLFQSKPFFREISLKWSSYFFLKYDDFEPNLSYYYYPIHLEPEAVVLYWGDGIYKNQVKLIENIAAQLPPNCFLYVKDHPHAGIYRDFADYQRIKSIPNLKLLDPSLPGKNIIRNSIGVITINGTSGFEALLLNKQVYTFGNCFYNYCNRVKYIYNIRDLRKTLYENRNNIYEDDEVLFKFLSAYLKSIHPGFTDYFLNYAELLGINEDMNAKIIAKGLIDYLEKCN